MPYKCFRCGYEVYLIEKCPNPPKDNQKQRKQVRFSERGNRELQKEYDNSENNKYQKIYASMACMSDNDEFYIKDFGDGLNLTSWILDSEATCHMKPQVQGFIRGSL